MGVTTSVLAALISAIGAYIIGSKKGREVRVTGEREKWREYLRDWTQELSILVHKYDENDPESSRFALVDKIETLRHSLWVRLNPHRDQAVENMVRRLQIVIKEGKSNNEVRLLTDYIIYLISKKLKNDWERVKSNLTLFGDGPLTLNISLIVMIVILLSAFTIFINPIDSNFISYSFVLTISLVGMKMIITELKKKQNIRALILENHHKRINSLITANKAAFNLYPKAENERTCGYSNIDLYLNCENPNKITFRILIIVLSFIPVFTSILLIIIDYVNKTIPSSADGECYRLVISDFISIHPFILIVLFLLLLLTVKSLLTVFFYNGLNNDYKDGCKEINHVKRTLY